MKLLIMKDSRSEEGEPLRSFSSSKISFSQFSLSLSYFLSILPFLIQKLNITERSPKQNGIQFSICAKSIILPLPKITIGPYFSATMTIKCDFILTKYYAIRIEISRFGP